MQNTLWSSEAPLHRSVSRTLTLAQHRSSTPRICHPDVVAWLQNRQESSAVMAVVVGGLPVLSIFVTLREDFVVRQLLDGHEPLVCRACRAGSVPVHQEGHVMNDIFAPQFLCDSHCTFHFPVRLWESRTSHGMSKAVGCREVCKLPRRKLWSIVTPKNLGHSEWSHNVLKSGNYQYA